MSINVTAKAEPAAVTGFSEEQFKRLIEHAIFAPSGHNTQPWLFRQVSDHLDLIADRTRGLPVVDPYDRELTMSCGAALDHLAIASRHYGRDLAIEICPDVNDPDVLARVRLGDAVIPTAKDHEAFDAIRLRRTTRVKYEDKTLPNDVSARCQELANQFGIELLLITDNSTRSKIADLVAEGDRLQFSDPRFRRELSSWVHSRRSASQDGMSGASFGMPDVLSPAGGFVIRTFDIGRGIAAGDKEKIIEGSPTLAVFASQQDTVSDWIATGRALSEVHLALTTAGATASYLNPPVEREELRPRLTSLIGCKGMPQLLMRFGYGPTATGSVRRKIDDILL